MNEYLRSPSNGHEKNLKKKNMQTQLHRHRLLCTVSCNLCLYASVNFTIHLFAKSVHRRRKHTDRITLHYVITIAQYTFRPRKRFRRSKVSLGRMRSTDRRIIFILSASVRQLVHFLITRGPRISSGRIGFARRFTSPVIPLPL